MISEQKKDTPDVLMGGQAQDSECRPYISIIIPIYNVEKYLRKCLDSCLSQTLSNIEIILVDDGSPDGCGEICDEYALQDSRIKIIHKANGGVGYARNSGLEIATGEYVYFVDPDDYIEKTACETLYMAAKEENVDICFANSYEVRDGQIIRKRYSPFSGKIIYPPETINTVFKRMLGRDPSKKEEKDKFVTLAAWQGIYLRSFLEENNLRFPSNKKGEDYLFNLNAIPLSRSIKYIPEFLYYYVSNPVSTVHVYRNTIKLENEYDLEKKTIISKYTEDPEMLVCAQTAYLGGVRNCLIPPFKEKRSAALEEIRKIVNDETLQEVLADYPKDIEIIPRITNYFLKHRSVHVLYFLSILANMRNRNRF